MHDQNLVTGSSTTCCFGSRGYSACLFAVCNIFHEEVDVLLQLFHAKQRGFVFSCIGNDGTEGIERETRKKTQYDAAHNASNGNYNSQPKGFILPERTWNDKKGSSDDASNKEEPKVNPCDDLNLQTWIFEHENSSYPFALFCSSDGAILTAMIATCNTKSKDRLEKIH